MNPMKLIVTSLLIAVIAGLLYVVVADKQALELERSAQAEIRTKAAIADSATGSDLRESAKRTTLVSSSSAAPEPARHSPDSQFPKDLELELWKSAVGLRRDLMSRYGFAVEYLQKLNKGEPSKLNELLAKWLEAKASASWFASQHGHQINSPEVKAYVEGQTALVIREITQMIGREGANLDEIFELEKFMPFIGPDTTISRHMEYYGIPLSSFARIEIARTLRDTKEQWDAITPATRNVPDPVTNLLPAITWYLAAGAQFLTPAQLAVIRRDNDETVALRAALGLK